MKGNAKRALFRVVIATPLLFCLPQPSLGAGPAAGPAEEERAWTETLLVLSPPLLEKIEQTNQFLDSQTTPLDDQLDQLKRLGYIDRRTWVDIGSNITDARQSLSGIDVTEVAGPVDARRARTIAYELGMASDALAMQAEKLNTDPADTSEAGRKRMETAEILAAISGYLHELAEAIVGNLK